MPPKASSENKINTLNEKALHAYLKSWYARPGDRIEASVDGFLVDLVRGDLLVEIQTANFSGIKRKLAKLSHSHPLRLVYPIASEKWIVKQDSDGARLSRRKSPKKGRVEHMFKELVSIPKLFLQPNFSLEVLLIQEEETRRHEPGRAWRRKGWVTEERHLLDVVSQQVFDTPEDLAGLLPRRVETPFTTLEIAEAAQLPRWLAQKMAFCLREMDVIHQVGKRGNAILYEPASPVKRRRTKANRTANKGAG